MSPSPRSQEIIEAALDLAEVQGVTGVTTAALARRLRFTEAALYRYYPGKTGILVGALEHLAERLLATMLFEVDQSAVSEAEHVARQLFHHSARFGYRQGLIIEMLLYAAANRAENLREAADAFMQEYRQRMAVYFTHLQERGLVPREIAAGELARLWICQLLGGFLHSRLTGERWQPEDQPGFRAFSQLLRNPPLQGS